MSYQPTRVRELGRSAISVISKYAHDGTFSAGKEVTKSLYKHWKTELENLQRVGRDHENVIRYFPNTIVTDQNITFFMELCDGSLQEYILDKAIVPSTSDSMEEINAREYFQSDILDICFQTVKGLQQLHNTYNIIHRDMKPSNVLLIRTPQKTTIAKVADFGLSRTLPPGSSSHHTTSTSTPEYMAKECYDERWIKSSDIFALGIVLYFAFTGGKHPFGEKRYKIEGNISEGKPPDFGLLRNSNSAFNKEQKITMVRMIKRMIKHDPKERLDIDDVFCHPTFWNSRKKIEFFLKIRDNLRVSEYNIPYQDVNEFESELLQDDAAGRIDEFNILETNLPDYLVLKKGVKRTKKNHHLINKCRSVNTLLDVIRNQHAHALDPGTPQQLRDDYGIEGDTLDFDKFLSIFITPYPQLLVHLYELFRKSKGAAYFYPRKGNQPPTGSMLPSEVAGLDSPKKWEQFFLVQGVTADDFYKYKITARYNGNVVAEGTYTIKDRRVKLFYPDPSQPVEQDTDSHMEFRMVPAGKSKILSNFTRGIILRTDPSDKSLIACRNCTVTIFYTSHKQQRFTKMEQGTDVTLFSFEVLHNLLHSSGSENLRIAAELVLGKNPNDTPSKTYPVTLTIESTAAAAVRPALGDLSLNDTDDVLISF